MEGRAGDLAIAAGIDIRNLHNTETYGHIVWYLRYASCSI